MNKRQSALQPSPTRCLVEMTKQLRETRFQLRFNGSRASRERQPTTDTAYEEQGYGLLSKKARKDANWILLDRKCPLKRSFGLVEIAAVRRDRAVIGNGLLDEDRQSCSHRVRVGKAFGEGILVFNAIEVED